MADDEKPPSPKNINYFRPISHTNSKPPRCRDLRCKNVLAGNHDAGVGVLAFGVEVGDMRNAFF